MQAFIVNQTNLRHGWQAIFKFALIYIKLQLFDLRITITTLPFHNYALTLLKL